MKLEDLELGGKRVLVRVDFNVPLNKNRQVTDATRIERALPTIRYILDHGGKPILMSHLGRPKGEQNQAFSLAPCLPILEKELQTKVLLSPDCVGKEVEEMAKNLKEGQVLLLENLRFHKGEEDPEKDPHFVKNLAKLGNCYVNDAFGTAHRSHASTTKIASFFKRNAAFGFLLEKEIAYLGQALLNPKRPLMAIIGGAKVSSKLGVLKALCEKADRVFIGGGMAYTFLKGKGVSIGESLVEEALIPTTQDILSQFGSKIFLPEDVVVAKEIAEKAATHVVTLEEGISEGWEGLDVGPKTLEAWEELLQDAKTIFWNGPLGVFEIAPFAKGTHKMAQILSQARATTVVGGGDSVAAINQMGLSGTIDHISTGGGAALEYIEYGTLPGIEALNQT